MIFIFPQCRDQLRAWSKKEAQDNPLWKRCLDAEGGFVNLALDLYFETLKLDHLIETQEPPKAKVRSHLLEWVCPIC